MKGQQPRTDSLFYYFRLEDQIPDDHLLKRLDRFIDFGFVRERLRDTYSAIGRPSIDPEVLLRLSLVGYLYGITSERRLIEEVRMQSEEKFNVPDGISREPIRCFRPYGLGASFSPPQLTACGWQDSLPLTIERLAIESTRTNSGKGKHPVGGLSNAWV